MQPAHAFAPNDHLPHLPEGTLGGHHRRREVRDAALILGLLDQTKGEVRRHGAGARPRRQRRARRCAMGRRETRCEPIAPPAHCLVRRRSPRVD